MEDLRKLRSLLALPASERNTRITDALRARVRQSFRRFLHASMSNCAYWLNRANGRFALVYRPDFHYDGKGFPEYSGLLKSWLAGNVANNCGDLVRFYTLYMNIKRVLNDKISGDMVELGVYKGNSAKLLASMCRTSGRHLYLFDTFAGFAQRDLRGIDSDQPVRFTDTSLAGVQELVGTDSVTYVQGLFPDSLEKVTLPEQLAVAHIDCDLYEPMKAALECFYPKMAPGGLLILHDYSSGFWPGATRAIDEFFANHPEKPVLVADKSGTAIIFKIAQS